MVMKRTMNLDKQGISTIIAAIVVIVIIGAAGVGAYVVVNGSSDKSSNNTSDPSNNVADSFADPLIQGNMGIGSTFTYDSAGVAYDGSSATVTQFTATIVGQSGSYYMLEIDISYKYGNYSDVYSQDTLAMISKTTGELRFASSNGADSIIYHGSLVSLNAYTLSTHSQGLGNDTLTLSSSPQDATPYKIAYYDSNYGYSFSGNLSSTNIKSPTTYSKSADIGKGFGYNVKETTRTGENVSGSCTAMCIAEGYTSRLNYGVTEDCKYGLFYENLNYSSGNGFIVEYMPYPVNAELSDPAAGYLLFDSAMDNNGNSNDFAKVSSERINTIDGSIMCDVYHQTTSGNYGAQIWIGQADKVPYLCEYNDRESITLTLSHYIR